MSAPPAKKIKECTSISIVVGKGDCLSQVFRINGYPWRLRLIKMNYGYWKIFVRCEKSMEAELWNCEAGITRKYTYFNRSFTYDCERNPRKYKFNSMEKKSQEHTICVQRLMEGERFELEITPSDDGNNPLEPRDGILLIEDKKMHVNKKSLASESPYFDRLFNGDFKEKDMNEIPIGEVSFEEFTNITSMVYGENGGSVVQDLLTRDNVHRILELAGRFELKIVEDGVVNSLLSSSSSYSIHESLFIVDDHNLGRFKARIISQYTNAQLKELSESPEVNRLSCQTLCALFKKSWEKPRR